MFLLLKEQFFPHRQLAQYCLIVIIFANYKKKVMLSVLWPDFLYAIIAFPDLFMLPAALVQLFSHLHNTLLCYSTFCVLWVLVLRNNTVWHVLICVSWYMRTGVWNCSLGPNQGMELLIGGGGAWDSALEDRVKLFEQTVPMPERSSRSTLFL